VELYLHHLIRLHGVILKHRYNFTCTSRESDAQHMHCISESHFMHYVRSMRMEHVTVLSYTDSFVLIAELLAVKWTTSLVHSD